MLIETDSSDGAALIARAKRATRAGDLPGAKALSERAWALPDAAPRLALQAKILRARSDYMAGDIELALPIVLQAVETAQAAGDVGGEEQARALIGRCLLAVRDTTRVCCVAWVGCCARPAAPPTPRRATVAKSSWC